MVMEVRDRTEVLVKVTSEVVVEVLTGAAVEAQPHRSKVHVV